MKRNCRIFETHQSQPLFGIARERSRSNRGSLEDGQSWLGCRLILDLLLEWARTKHLQRSIESESRIFGQSPLYPKF